MNGLQFALHTMLSWNDVIPVAPLAGASSRSPVLLTIDPGLTEAGAEAVGGTLFLSSYRYIGTGGEEMRVSSYYLNSYTS